MATMRGHDPLKIIGSWVTSLGAYDILDGRISGAFLSRSLDNPTWTLESDGQGNTTRVYSPTTSGSVVVTISQSSPTNKVLSRVANEDKISQNMVGMLSIKDLSGSTVILAADAFLEGLPTTIAFGSDRGDMIWKWMFGSSTEALDGRDKL